MLLMQLQYQIGLKGVAHRERRFSDICFTGEFIEEKLKDYGIKSDFVKIKGDTRECLAIITNDLIQTEILEPGPIIDNNERVNFIEKFNKLSESANIIVISGSVPQNIETGFYRELIEIANKKNKKVLLDTSGILLVNGVKGKPYFVKPNRDEIEALTGRVKITRFYLSINTFFFTKKINRRYAIF